MGGAALERPITALCPQSVRGCSAIPVVRLVVTSGTCPIKKGAVPHLGGVIGALLFSGPSGPTAEGLPGVINRAPGRTRVSCGYPP